MIVFLGPKDLEWQKIIYDLFKASFAKIVKLSAIDFGASIPLNLTIFAKLALKRSNIVLMNYYYVWAYFFHTLNFSYYCIVQLH